jgi:hypothetical protein
MGGYLGHPMEICKEFYETIKARIHYSIDKGIYSIARPVAVLQLCSSCLIFDLDAERAQSWHYLQRY